MKLRRQSARRIDDYGYLRRELHAVYRRDPRARDLLRRLESIWESLFDRAIAYSDGGDKEMFALVYDIAFLYAVVHADLEARAEVPWAPAEWDGNKPGEEWTGVVDEDHDAATPKRKRK